MHAHAHDTLPSGATVEFSEMTGNEEVMLANERMMRDGTAVNRLLKNCIKRIGDNDDVTEKDVLALLSGDRLYALMRIRQLTHGDECALELICRNPKCGEKHTVLVNLNDVATKPYGAEREFECLLPKAEKVVKFRIPDGNDEQRLVRMKEAADLHTMLLMRIVSVDGKPPTKHDILSLSASDLGFLRAEMHKIDAGPDTEVHSVCPVCGTPIQTRLEGEPGFLFPRG